MKAGARKLIIALALAAAVAAVYLPALHYGYLNFDDNVNVFENSYLYPVRGETFLFFWSVPYSGLYIPGTYSVWAAVAWLARLAEGASPRACPGAEYFHGLNIALHAANSILVFLLLRLLLSGSSPSAINGTEERRRDLAAALGGGLFALHPVQVETVIWITALKDLLSGFFSLLALLRYVSWRRAGGRGRSGFAQATVFFLLSLFAKPSATALPLLAGLLDLGILKVSLRRSISALVWWVIFALPLVVLTKIVEPDSVIRFVPPFRLRFLVAADALVFYLGKLLFPVRLAIDYGRTPRQILAGGVVFAPLLIVTGLALLVIARKIRGAGATALGLATAVVLPVSGVIPFVFQNISTVKDRYLYFALLGPALALAWLAARSRRRTAGVAAVGIIIFFALGSCRQRSHWRNMVVLYQRVIRINPRSVFSHNNLANYLARGGKINEAGVPFRRRQEAEPDPANLLSAPERSELALVHYRRALAIDPGYTDALVNLAQEQTRRGELEAARRSYEEALRQEPERIEARNNLGFVLAELGRTKEAIPHYRETLRRDPLFPKAHLNLANAYTVLGREELALTHYQEALRLDPGYAKAHYNLALLHHRRGEVYAALSHYTAALRSQPEFIAARHNRRVLLDNLANRDRGIIGVGERGPE